MWDVLTDIAAWLGWVSGSLAFVIALGNAFRLNRKDEDQVRVDERLYALEEEAGIGPGGSWTERASPPRH